MSLNEAAIIIALLSLYVSIRVAWETSFRPAKIVAIMPHSVMWQFSSWKGDKPTGDVVSRQMTPSLRIRNFGARPVVIEDLRIKFKTSSTTVFAYPVNKVAEEIMEDTSNNKYQHGLGHGSPFCGISLASNQEWKNSYAFSMNVKDYEALIDDVNVSVEIRKGGSDKWKSIHKDIFEFGSMPYHLRSLKTETTAAGSTISTVYSKRWNETHSK